MLAVTFAVLNDALHLPPFSLLVVALTLTDGKHSSTSRLFCINSNDVPVGMTLTFFFNVKDTGERDMFLRR